MTTSASASRLVSDSHGSALAPISTASARARSGDRLVTRIRSAPRSRSALADRAPIFPAPTSSTARPRRSPKIFSTSSTATWETLPAPRAISVSVRTRFAVAKARLHRRDTNVPAVSAEAASP